CSDAMSSRRALDMSARMLACSASVLLSLGAIAATPLGSPHPEEAYPDDAAPLASPGRFDALIKEVQRNLHREGFDAGPINGDFGAKTQAALAQFQLAYSLPASGALDERTLA